jgi:hypothetical protein
LQTITDQGFEQPAIRCCTVVMALSSPARSSGFVRNTAFKMNKGTLATAVLTPSPSAMATSGTARTIVCHARANCDTDSSVNVMGYFLVKIAMY